MSSSSSNISDPLDIDYKNLDEFCVQSVHVTDEIFEPNYNDELVPILDYPTCETHFPQNIIPVTAKSSSAPSTSTKRRRVPKYPVKENEILLPCTYCRRTISYENYEKHLAVHTSEQAAIINEVRDSYRSDQEQMKPICIEQSETTICRTCNEAIPTDTFKCHLAQHMDIQNPPPIQAVTVKEELMWLADNQNEFPVEIDPLKPEIMWLEGEEIDPTDVQTDPLVEIDTANEREMTQHVNEKIDRKIQIQETGETKLQPAKGEKVVQYVSVLKKTMTATKMMNTKLAELQKRRKVLLEPIKNEDRATCGICHRVVSSANMQKHMLTHSTGNILLNNIMSINGLKQDKNDNVSAMNVQHDLNNAAKNYGMSSASNICQLGNQFFRPEQVIDHWMTHLGNKNSKICPFCSMTCDDVQQFSEHVSLHVKKPFVCCHCDQKFMQYSELKEHQMRREDEKRFLCVICYRSFYQCYHVKYHHMAHHKEDKFSLRDTLKEPFTTCTNEKSSSNTKADDLFSSRKDLGLQTKKLLQDKLFVCSYCELVCQNYCDLSKHMLTHKKENSVTCTLCRKLIQMEEVVHRRKGIFMCSSCSTSLLNTKFSLSSDAKEVDGNQPKIDTKKPSQSQRMHNVKTFSPSQKSKDKSKQDERKLPRKQSLRQRNLSHVKEEKFLCSHCNQHFARETSLKRHLVFCRIEHS